MISVFEEGEPIDLRWPKGKRVAVKPNLTFPTYKPGVTTSPAVLERVVEALVGHGNEVAVVESDGGYGAWSCETAFEGHGVYDICRRHGAKAVNLTREPWATIPIPRAFGSVDLPFPRRFLGGVDVLVTMPVPKVHCMTGVTLSLKNQWGIVPDPLRMNFHYLFERAIVEITKRLPPSMVVADGTWFLDGNGPMLGTPLRKGLVIAADSLGEFDRYLCALMGVDPWTVRHLALGMRQGIVPEDLAQIEFDRARFDRHRYQAKLHRTLRNRVVLVFFHSRALTRLIYTSSFGRLLHKAFYFFVPPAAHDASIGPEVEGGAH